MKAVKHSASSWLSFPNSNTEADLRLFCFPYAGGGAHIFHPWQEKMSSRIEICTVQMPGRGARFTDKPHSDYKTVINELVPVMSGFMDKPYALFGHSMGTLLAYELAQAMQSRGLPQPVHLFVAGRRAMHIGPFGELTHELTDEFLIGRLRKLKGTPDEVLDNRELMNLILPAIRADFKLCDSYRYNERHQKLTVDITAFEGVNDFKAQGADISAWQELTLGNFQSRQLPGDHFFIHSSEQALVRLIDDELSNLTMK